MSFDHGLLVQLCLVLHHHTSEILDKISVINNRQLLYTTNRLKYALMLINYSKTSIKHE